MSEKNGVDRNEWTEVEAAIFGTSRKDVYSWIDDTKNFRDLDFENAKSDIYDEYKQAAHALIYAENPNYLWQYPLKFAVLVFL
jgi:hypothetical protein